MGTTQEKYVGDGKMSTTPDKKLNFKLKDKSVTTAKIADGAVTAEKVDDSVINEKVKPLTDDLQEQINGIQISGMRLKQGLGDDKNAGVSQKALTGLFSDVYDLIEDITGVPMQGIDMTIDRNYYVGEEGEDITITITPPAEGGGYDHVKVLDGETVLLDEDNVTEVRTLSHHVSESTTIRCVATILGVEYEAEQPISKITAFYIGGGETAADVMTEDCHRTIVGGSIDGEYEVEMGDGDYLFIVMDVAYRDLFHRADMNGFEIPMKAMTEVTIEGSTYVVGQSENQYNEGEYSIYINR